MKRLLVALLLLATPAFASPKACEHYRTYTDDRDPEVKIAVCFDNKRPRLVTGPWAIVTINGKTVLLEDRP